MSRANEVQLLRKINTIEQNRNALSAVGAMLRAAREVLIFLKSKDFSYNFVVFFYLLVCIQNIASKCEINANHYRIQQNIRCMKCCCGKGLQVRCGSIFIAVSIIVRS